MSCVEIRERLYDRLYGLVEEPEAGRIDRHVEGCAECREELRGLTARDALLDAWKPEYQESKPIRVESPRRRIPSGVTVAAGFLLAFAATFFFPAPEAYDAVSGSRLRVQEAQTIRLGRAGRVDLEPGAEVVFKQVDAGRDREIELVAGTIHAEVTPTGNAFRVRIGERAVEVRGTTFSVQRLGAVELGEDLMKRWNAAVALVAVSAGSVVVTGPGESYPVEAGRAVIATPAGVEKLERTASSESLLSYRNQLAQSVADREQKARVLREAVEALRAKYGRVQLPPGATLEGLLASLKEALKRLDVVAAENIGVQLGLLLKKDESLLEPIVRLLFGARDPDLTVYLASAISSGGQELLSRHPDVARRLILSAEAPLEVRAVILDYMGGWVLQEIPLSAADVTALLKNARALAGGGDEAAKVGRALAELAVHQMSPGAEPWMELRRLLEAEQDPDRRSELLKACFDSPVTRDRSSIETQELLMDALRGRFGPEPSSDLLSQPLVRWFSPGTAETFAAAFQEAAKAFTRPRDRQRVAGQLGILFLLQQAPAARDGLKTLHAAEQDPGAKGRMGQVLEALDNNELDLDILMERLQLDWRF